MFSKRRGDRGFTLIEMLVAMVITAIVGATIVTAIVQTNNSARYAAGTATTQAQIVDAMSRIGKDISVATTVTAASTDSITVRGMQNGACTQDMFKANPSGNLNDVTTVLNNTSSCPPKGGSVKSTSTTAIVKKMTSQTVFTYYDANNVNVDPAAGTSAIRRVSFTISANPADRPGTLTLTSSATLATSVVPVGAGGQDAYPAPVLTGNTSGKTGVLTWTQPLGATTYVLTRDGATVYSGSSSTYTDTAINWGDTHLYYVYAVFGDGNQSDASNGVVLQWVPAAPVLQGKLVANDADGDGIANDGQLTWSAVAGADSYTLYADYGTGGAVIYKGKLRTFNVPDLPYRKDTNFWVYATNAAGTSPKSNIVPLQPALPKITPTPVLTGQVGDRTSKKDKPNEDYGCTLDWTLPQAKPYGVLGYYVYVYWTWGSNHPTGWQLYQNVADPDSTGVGHLDIEGGDDSMCQDGFTFSWYVVAYNDAASHTTDSPPSNTVTLMVPPGPLSMNTYDYQDSFTSDWMSESRIVVKSAGASTYRWIGTNDASSRVAWNTGWKTYTPTDDGDNGTGSTYYDTDNEPADAILWMTTQSYAPNGLTPGDPPVAQIYHTSPRMPSRSYRQLQVYCSGKGARELVRYSVTFKWAGTTATHVRFQYHNASVDSDPLHMTDFNRAANSADTTWVSPSWPSGQFYSLNFVTSRDPDTVTPNLNHDATQSKVSISAAYNVLTPAGDPLTCTGAFGWQNYSGPPSGVITAYGESVSSNGAGLVTHTWN